jgi:hypothetical protein
VGFGVIFNAEFSDCMSASQAAAANPKGELSELSEFSRTSLKLTFLENGVVGV